jgi:anion-transporting  ArsA/GET3 family ATPase
MNVLDVPAHDEGTRALRALVTSRKVIVCVGSGGVGKTTTAATLGLYGASIGKRTLVITIDPARRLANALGLNTLAHAPQRIDDTVVKAAGLVGTAPLSAMMLDLKAAWDDMLFRTAPSTASAENILGNRFYAALSQDLPGAHEFIACEALNHVVESGAYDLVVLDTPPTSNALDFLEAPARVLAVLDNEAFKLVTSSTASRAGSIGARLFDGATGRAQGLLAKFTGGEMLHELTDFIVLLRDLYAPLTEKARAFEKLLRGEATRFVVVTSPQQATLDEAVFFARELQNRSLPLGCVVVNRVTPRPGNAATALDDGSLDAHMHARDLNDDDSARMAVVLDEACRRQQLLADLDDTAITNMRTRVGAAPLVHVPRLHADVVDARRLAELLPWLVGPR